MLVREWMTKNPVTVEEDGSMDDAIRLLKERKIRMLPVMKKHKLVGIVTDGDVKRASASDATTLDIHELLYLISRIKVRNIMTREPISVTPDFTVEETAELLLKKKISCVPVVDSREALVGVITQSDIFKVLISLTGVGKRGVQFAFMVEDRPGSIKEVADIVRTRGGRMASILSSYDKAPEGYRRVYIRSFDLDRRVISELKAVLPVGAQLLYIVDHREGRREVYEGAS
jgi:acetoin utilization protein AcuB